MNDDELRDFFAGMVVVGLVPYMNEKMIPVYAKLAYAFSDAMLEAKKERSTNDCRND